MDIENLEPRKLAEIEHSRRRRAVLQGFEREIDGAEGPHAAELSELVADHDQLAYHYSNMKFYSVTQESENAKLRWLETHCSKGHPWILDYACGNGENALAAAEYGASVIGIDISPEGIENARKNAAHLGVEQNCHFEVMDGENLTFPDGKFDLVIEYGALHHVELSRALSEISRVLKPGGRVLCIEALRHNPIIHAYRHRTPHLRTEWEVEHILGVESLTVMREYFSEVDVDFYHLTSLALVPLRKTRVFKPLLRIANAIDRLLLKRQPIGKFGWIMIVELAQARK